MPLLPLVGCCHDSLWFEALEDHVLEGARVILQEMDQPGRLELDITERSDSHPAEPVSYFVPPPQIVRGQRRWPFDG
jgi:hypothetical protein